MLPLLFVWLSDLADRAASQGMELASARVAESAAEAWGHLATEEDARARTDALASQAFARIRVTDAQGNVLHDVDHEGFPLLDGLAALVFFGPGPPSFAQADATLPPLSERAETRSAWSGGGSSRCTRADPGPVLLCASARRTADHTGGSAPALRQRDVVVHVEIGSRRAIRALYDVRYPFIKLTLYMLLVGLALWVWLDRRMVAPVLHLRDQIRDRKVDLVTVQHGRPDEIGELADTFNDLVRTLDARNRANAGFMADLAHELKNPVAAVRVAAESLEGGRPVDEERAKRLGTVLMDASRRLDTIVTQFLEIARAEAGLSGQARVRIDLYALAVGLAEAVTARGGPEVVAHGGTAFIDGVPDRVESVLRNLVDNATSFARSKVVIAVTQDASRVVLTVADDGPGIAPEDLPRVFDRFYTRRADNKGTGLGLALVKAIVEAHGGTVTVRPGEGVGAVFEVCWPPVSAARPT